MSFLIFLMSVQWILFTLCNFQKLTLFKVNSCEFCSHKGSKYWNEQVRDYFPQFYSRSQPCEISHWCLVQQFLRPTISLNSWYKDFITTINNTKKTTQTPNWILFFPSINLHRFLWSVRILEIPFLEQISLGQSLRQRRNFTLNCFSMHFLQFKPYVEFNHTPLVDWLKCVLNI